MVAHAHPHVHSYILPSYGKRSIISNFHDNLQGWWKSVTVGEDIDRHTKCGIHVLYNNLNGLDNCMSKQHIAELQEMKRTDSDWMTKKQIRVIRMQHIEETYQVSRRRWGYIMRISLSVWLLTHSSLHWLCRVTSGFMIKVLYHTNISVQIHTLSLIHMVYLFLHQSAAKKSFINWWGFLTPGCEFPNGATLFSCCCIIFLSWRMDQY